MRDYVGAIVNRYNVKKTALENCQERHASDENQIRQLKAFRERALQAEQENRFLKEENRKLNKDVVGWEHLGAEWDETIRDLEKENVAYINEIHRLQDSNKNFRK